MLLEGRKYPRTSERFLVHVSSVRDPRVSDVAFVENLSTNGARIATERIWEPGCHVDVKSRVRELTARARVVYCKSGIENRFIIGLNFLSQTMGPDAGSKPADTKEEKQN